MISSTSSFLYGPVTDRAETALRAKAFGTVITFGWLLLQPFTMVEIPGSPEDFREVQEDLFI